MNNEMEVEDWLPIIERFDGEPAVSVVAHVSGRLPGTEEVKMFACALLRIFSGASQDEYTSHLWTHEEIEANVLIEGHPFFDYMGWYEQEQQEQREEREENARNHSEQNAAQSAVIN